MEKITLQETIDQCSMAFVELERAKADCKHQVESALDAYAEAEPEATKADFKSIKKIAKAIATGKRKECEEEAISLKDLVDAVTGPSF